MPNTTGKATYSSAAFGLGITALLVVLYLLCFSSSSEDGKETLEKRVESQTMTTIITTEYPAKAFAVPTKTRNTPEILTSWDIVRDDLTYLVELDGGPQNGGVEFTIPARKKWGSIGYDPSTNHHYFRTVRFKLATGQGVQSADLNLIAEIVKN